MTSAALAAGLGAQAQAQTPGPVTGVYIGGGAGANWRLDAQTPAIRMPAETGWVALGALGYGFGNGLRAEVEGNYRENTIHRWYGSTAQNSGSLRSYGVMVNFLYDFATGTPFVPYVGGGVGYVWSEINNARATIRGTNYKINDVEGNFGYQVIIGTAYNIDSALALTAEYRYFGSVENDFGVSRVGSNAAGLPNTFRPTNNNHAALLGIRYAFNQPTPALVAAPVAPAAANTYLVFFDWDRYDLTTRARQIIGEAASAARSKGSAKIEVAGHADRSGTPQYNQRLSQRRADAVAAELVRDGIARTEIAVSAYGETRPLVPTADGVREPQNRRVEIVLR